MYSNYKCQVLGSKHVSGNSISHSNKATKRWFRINHHAHTFFSPILNKNIVLEKTSTRGRRTILKHYFIDNYVILHPATKLTKELLSIRNQIKKTIGKEAFLQKRKDLLLEKMCEKTGMTRDQYIAKKKESAAQKKI